MNYTYKDFKIDDTILYFNASADRKELVQVREINHEYMRVGHLDEEGCWIVRYNDNNIEKIRFEKIPCLII